MTSTDTSEGGLESLIVAWMTEKEAFAASTDVDREADGAGGGEWLLGNADDYLREYGRRSRQLRAFLG